MSSLQSCACFSLVLSTGCNVKYGGYRWKSGKAYVAILQCQKISRFAFAFGGAAADDGGPREFLLASCSVVGLGLSPFVSIGFNRKVLTGKWWDQTGLEGETRTTVPEW